MAAKSKLTYKIYEHRGSGQWHWEVATAEGQVVEQKVAGAFRAWAGESGEDEDVFAGGESACVLDEGIGAGYAVHGAGAVDRMFGGAGRVIHDVVG